LISYNVGSEPWKKSINIDAINVSIRNIKSKVIMIAIDAKT